MSRALEAAFPFLLIAGGIAAMVAFGRSSTPTGSLLSGNCDVLKGLDPETANKYIDKVLAPYYLKHRATTDNPEFLALFLANELNPECAWDVVVDQGAPDNAVVWLCKLEAIVRIWLAQEAGVTPELPAEVIECALGTALEPGVEITPATLLA